MNSTIDRFAPLSGIAFAVLLVVGVSLGGNSPGLGATSAEMVEYSADNAAILRLSSLVLALAMVALLLFVGCLRSATNDQRAPSGLREALLGGGVIAAAGIGVDAALRFALVESVDDISPEAHEALYALWNGYFWAIHVGFGILVLAASLLALSATSFPNWLVAVGVLASLLLIVPIVAVTLIGLIFGGLWVIATSVLLFRQSPAT